MAGPGQSASVGDFLVLDSKDEQHLLAVTRCLHPSATDEVPASPPVPIRQEQKYGHGTRPPPRYN